MSNLLKNNAYHILGLDTSASQKDIVKRSKDLIKLIQIDDIPKYDFDIDIFQNFRTENNVKEAVQKLTSPKKQIKDYFFWFHITDEIDEQAVGILRKNDINGAILVWEHHAEGDSPKALFYKKNLAVLYCLLLFKKDNEHYLKSSLKIWNEVVNSSKFWSSFNRVFKLNDELNTSQEVIDDFQKNCVSYISDLYTEIAEDHKDNKYVSEFSSVFNNSKGIKTSKVLLEPIFNEMSSSIEELESMKISDDGILDKQEALAIKKHVSIIQNGCNKLIELGLYDDSQSKIIRDRAGNALRSISIDLNNNLNETSIALGLSKIADKISGTEGFKNKIQEDLKTIQKNDDQKNFDEKYKQITDPILKDFKNGNSDRALKTINEYIYNEKTDEVLKKELRELKELIEKHITEHGKPGSPSMGTLNSVGTKMYGDTLYFVVLFIPIIPISRWSCQDHGNGTYTFYGKLELTQAQKTWRTIAILVVIGLIIWGLSSS